MTVKICCVGKLKESFFIEACAEYQKRLGRFCTVKISEVPDEKAPETLSPAEEEQVKDREGERLLAAIDPKDHVIALAMLLCMLPTGVLAADSGLPESSITYDVGTTPNVKIETAGVIQGRGDNIFDPETPLTTEEAIAITYRALGAIQ